MFQELLCGAPTPISRLKPIEAVFSQEYWMLLLPLHEKCPYSELFWPVFSRIRTEYGPEQLQVRTFFTQYTWNVLRQSLNPFLPNVPMFKL